MDQSLHVKSFCKDDFEMMAKLGEGGFGTVTLARLKSNQRLFALKSLSKSRYTRTEELQRVLNESDALQKVRHPFIMRMFGAWQDEYHFYMLLELASGGDMFAAVETHRIFPEDWCAIYVAEIALALEHIHELGFMHRDLKLENVLIASSGHIKLGDFGLAKKFAPEAAQPAGLKRPRNTIIGSTHSMAPEIFTDRNYGTTVDWWSLGVVLCEMLVGQAPLPEAKGDYKQLLAAYASGDFMRPFAEPVSPSAEQLIRGLLTVPVELRLSSVSALQPLPFFGSLDWTALERLEVVAPLGAESLKKHEETARSRAKQRKTSQEVTEMMEDFSEFVHVEAVGEAAGGAAAGGAAAGGADGAGDAKQLAAATAAELNGMASNNDVTALRAVLRAGGNLSVGDYDRRYPIHLAASEGQLDAVRFLVGEAAVDHSPADRWGGTPLDDARRHGHAAIVDLLAALGAACGTFDPTSDLCSAAARGDVEALATLARARGFDVDAGDYDGRTPIHLAASEGHLAAVRFLVEELGANVSPTDRWRGTPLDDATRHGHAAVVEFLTSRGAQPGTGQPQLAGAAAAVPLPAGVPPHKMTAAPPPTEADAPGAKSSACVLL